MSNLFTCIYTYNVSCKYTHTHSLRVYVVNYISLTSTLIWRVYVADYIPLTNTHICTCRPYVANYICLANTIIWSRYTADCISHFYKHKFASLYTNSRSSVCTSNLHAVNCMRNTYGQAVFN